MNGTTVDISLWSCRDEFILITHPSDIKFKLNVEDIYLSMWKVAVSDKVMSGLDVSLKNLNGKYSCKRTNIYTYNVFSNSYSDTLEDI